MKKVLFAFSLLNALFLHGGPWQISLLEELGVNYYTPLSHRTFEYMYKCDAHFTTMQVPEFSGKNLPADNGIPGVRIDYVKNFNYFDPPMYEAVYTPETPLDLSNCRRMTGKLTTITGHGYYSGRWYIGLTDKNQKKVSFCIGKESWRFRNGHDFELPLTGFPAGFDRSAVITVTFTGYAPVHAHRGMIMLENLAFDADSPTANETARREAFRQAMAGNPELQVFPVAPETVVFPDSVNFTADDSPFYLRTARGGSDDLQLIITPGQDPRTSITVEAAGFTAENGSKIPAECVKFYELLFVPTLPEQYDGVFEGRYPDILRPLSGKFAGRVPLYRERITALWVKVSVPHDATPGVYSGKLLIGGKEVALTLTVDNFTMPSRPTLRTSFWLFPNRIPRQNPDKPATFEDLRPWIDAALEAKMTPILTTENAEDEPFTVTRQSNGTYSVDLSAWQNYYTYVMNHGGNAIHIADTHWFGRRLFNLPGPFGFTGESPEDLAKHDPQAIVPHRLQIMQSYLEAVRAFLKANNWQDFAYLQLWDEPNVRARETILPLLYGTMHRMAPDIRLALTKSIPDELSQFVTMPIPSIPAVDNGFDQGRGYSANARRLGRSPWMYSCVSYGLTITEVPVRNRLLPLYCFAGNIDGYLFWALNYYDMNKVRNFPAQPWPLYRSNTGVREGTGDGVMLYPPEPGNTEPMSCCRMQLWRSGMEDFEYLTELRRLLNEKEDKIPGNIRAAILELLDISALLNRAWEHPELPDVLRSHAGDTINYLQTL